MRPAAGLLLLLAAAVPPSARQLQDVQRAQQADLAAKAAAQAQAQAQDELARKLAAERVAAASRLRAAEDALEAASQRVDKLARRRDAAQARAASDAKALAPLLPLIERLSLFPAETLLATPAPPEDAVRGALVLGGLVRELRRRAAAVAAERAELARLQSGLDAALPGLQAAEQAQRTQSAALDAALAQAQGAHDAAQTRAEAAARRAAADASRAGSLRAAIAALDRARRDAARKLAQQRAAAPSAEVATAAALPAARGGWASPVAGRIVRAYGTPGDGGPAAGTTIQAPPGARVVSPCGGRVVFAAPFRSYGKLIIVDCGGDSHVVLGGLDRIDVAPGRTVQAGEPVGVMAAASASPLYLELRRGGQTVDPGTFLAAHLHGNL